MKVLHLLYEVLQNQILLKTDILDADSQNPAPGIYLLNPDLDKESNPDAVILRNSDSIWILVQPRSSPEFLDNSFKIFTAENKF